MSALTHMDAELLRIVRRQGSIGIAVLTMQNPDPIGANERVKLLLEIGYLAKHRTTNTQGRTAWSVSITDAGADSLELYESGHRAANRTVVPASTSGPYDGRELRPFTGRPGAMDAYRLPSLMAGQRVPRGAAAVNPFEQLIPKAQRGAAAANGLIV